MDNFDLFDEIDSLDNIDQSDLLNFEHDELLKNSFVLNTPPETPINQNQGNNFPNEPNGVLYLDSTLPASPYPIPNLSITGNSTNPSYVLSQASLGQSNSPPTCLPALVINCQPTVLSPASHNGYQVNGNSLLHSQNLDNPSISKGHIQPKIILPSKISPGKVVEDSGCGGPVLDKRQRLEARKVRNREAALNSRLKKKEYVDNLEAEIKRLSQQNASLGLENKQLRQRVKDLEMELSQVKSTDINGNYDSSRKKVKISFFAVICMFCLQVSPYLVSVSPGVNSTDIHPNGFFPKAAKPEHHIGRNLLWVGPTDSHLSPKAYYKFNKRPVNSSNYNESILCDEFVNKTESLRLESELRDWLTRLNLEKNQTKRKSKSLHHFRSRQEKERKLLYDSKHMPIPRLRLWMQKQKSMDDYLDDEFEQTIDHLSPFDFDSLMTMVHRRDDTFYYLSYPSKGHLILPPISNRTDIRPRFSFLIPTYYNLSLDGSLSNSSSSNHNSSIISPQMFMLQINCQVINTKVTLIDAERQGFRERPAKATSKAGKKIHNTR